LLALGIASAATAPPTEEAIGQLIRQLGSDDFDQREAAAKRLIDIGDPALTALNRATTSDDTEVRRRAADILNAIDDRLYGPERTLTGHEGCIWSLSVSADGKRLLTSSGDRTLRLWDALTGAQLRVFTGHMEGIGGGALSADGKRALSGSADKTARLWDADTGKELLRLNGSTGIVRCVAFGPEGKALLGCADGKIQVWDLSTGRIDRVLTGHIDYVFDVAYSAKAGLAASCGVDKSIRLWDLDTGKEVRRLRGHTDAVVNVRFSADGKRLVSSCYDHTVRLWDAATGQELKRLRVPEGFSVALSSDGKRLVTGGIRNHPEVRVWDVETGKELNVYADHRESAACVLFLPNGRRIVSAGDDRSIHIRRVPR
jgi:hypothetical protein